jgi:hypothetical protein
MHQSELLPAFVNISQILLSSTKYNNIPSSVMHIQAVALVGLGLLASGNMLNHLCYIIDVASLIRILVVKASPAATRLPPACAGTVCACNPTHPFCQNLVERAPVPSHIACDGDMCVCFPNLPRCQLGD